MFGDTFRRLQHHDHRPGQIATRAHQGSSGYVRCVARVSTQQRHYLTFWTGRTQALRAATSSVLPAWNDSLPGYASLLGMHAFALEESGNHFGAEAIGREAVERNPNALWAIHSVAHVLETQGRSAEGVAWFDYPTDAWDDRNPFRRHVWWCAALFNAAQGRYDNVLSLYDNVVTSVNTPQNIDVQNLASLLARLELRRVDIGDRWDALAEHSETRIGDHDIVFNDIHWSLAMAAGGRTKAASHHAQATADFASTEPRWLRMSLPLLAPTYAGVRSHGETRTMPPQPT